MFYLRRVPCFACVPCFSLFSPLAIRLCRFREKHKQLYKSSEVAKLEPLIGGGCCFGAERVFSADNGEDERAFGKVGESEKVSCLGAPPLPPPPQPLVFVSVGWHHVRKLD